MIISASRPYFAPFPGFFYRLHLADVFVILDSVQFPRGTTWITRNRFKNDQGTLWMTIPVWKKGLGLQSIDDVRVCREGSWPRKYPASLKQAYADAPYFYEQLQFIENLFSTASGRLIDFNLAIIRHLMLNLGLDTEIIRLSELNIDAWCSGICFCPCRFWRRSTSHTVLQPSGP